MPDREMKREKENRGEATQRGMKGLYQRQCGNRESYFVLNSAANRQPMEIKKQRSDVGRFWSFVDEAS